MKTIELKTQPISVNKMYRGRRFLTKEGKDIKEAIKWEIAAQWQNELLTGPVTLNVMFYVSNGGTDIDNQLKGLLDCMTKLVYKDDSLIEELHVYKTIDKENPRTVIQVV